MYIKFKNHLPLSKSLITHISLVVVLAGAVAGCVTAPKPAAQPSLPELLAQAKEEAGKGQTEKALPLLETAAKNNPANKEAWLEIAQIHFDAGNYGKAVVAAQEAIQRDPLDRQAHSIMTVAGLRIATQGLAALRKENHLSGSVRSEAERLAQSLRDSLGEAVLVPPLSSPGTPEVVAAPVAPVKSTSKRSKSKAGKPAVKAPDAVSGGDPKPPVIVPRSNSSNPFEGLR